MTRPPSPPHSRQRGFTTLAVSLVMLFVMSLMVFHTSSGMLLEIKTGNNQYYQAKALEAARGGVEYGMAWLFTGNNVGTLKNQWGAPASGETIPNGSNQKATISPFTSTQNIGGYPVKITLWSHSGTSLISGIPSTMELQAEASGDASVVVRQKIRLETKTTSTSATVNLANKSPIVATTKLEIKGNPRINFPIPSNNSITINGATSGVTGLDHLKFNDANGEEVTTDLSKTVVTMPDGTTSTLSYIFGATTLSQLKDYYTANPNGQIVYYDGNYLKTLDGKLSPPSNNSSTYPQIIIVDPSSSKDCPKLEGTFYGLIYFTSLCDQANGWGSVNIYGSVAFENSTYLFNANVDFYQLNGSNSSIQIPGTVNTVNQLVKQSASWRDF